MAFSRGFATTWLAAILAYVVSEAPASACVAGIAPQTGAAPAFNGKFAFQAINASGADHIYLYDTAKPGRVQIDAGWNFTTALNPDLSRNGLWVAFGATSPACADNTGQYSQIYVYLLGSASAPSPLTACDFTQRDDVKFSADMGSVVFKHRATSNGVAQDSLETLSLRLDANGAATVLAHATLVQDTVERSAPSLSPMSNYVYYYKGSKSNLPEVLYRMNLVTKAETAMSPTSGGINAYYPHVRDATVVYYARNTSSAPNDQLYYQAPSLQGLGVETPVSFSDCNVNNSDPAPLNEDYLLFSRPGPSGDYELFVGLLGTTKIWSLSTLLQISGGSDPIHGLLGSSFYPRLRGVAP